MKSYYYADSNNVQQGPFELEELKQQPINRNTLVWHSGLAQWTLASGVKELSDLFENTPPTLNSVAPAPPAPLGMPPKTWLLESILVMVCCFLPLGLVGLIYASGVESKWRRGLYAEALHDSNEAGRWTKLGLIIGIILMFIVPVLIIITGGTLFSIPFMTPFPVWHM